MRRPPATRIYDPICGMWLDASQVAVTFTYISWTYAFCCQECRDLFARTPEVHVVRLAHDPEACMGHWCPFLRQSAGGCAASAATRQKDV